jgi:hypothetical protein
MALTCKFRGRAFELLGSETKQKCSRVEAGKNASTVIPASRNRRRKGNPVVSDETVIYGYESSATLTTDRLDYKLHTRPLIREGRILLP